MAAIKTATQGTRPYAYIRPCPRVVLSRLVDVQLNGAEAPEPRSMTVEIRFTSELQV
jgi:hypothetical protein